MTNNIAQLKIAEKYIGKGGAIFRKFCGLPKGASYCDAYVSYIFHEAGNAMLFCSGKKQTYCPTTIKILQKYLAQIPVYLALPSDVIFFDWEGNGVPNHIGFVREKYSTNTVLTIEGNTNGGIVARKSRSAGYVQGVFRPHFKPDKVGKAKLKTDGNFGYYSIYNLQLALGVKPTGILTKETVKYLQRKCGATPDGVWGLGTSKKVQKMIGATPDGDFGPASVAKLQAWINKINYPAAKKPAATKPAAAPKKPAPAKKPATPVKAPAKKQTNTEKLIAKAKYLAWAYGTPEKKYKYKTGAPKAVCKAAMKKYGWADNKGEMSDCGNFVSTIVRESGVDKTFKALHGTKTPFQKTEKAFKIVHTGKIPNGLLKAGDIIRYKKKNGHQHAMIYFGSGKVCEASHYSVFGVIRKDSKRYNTQSKTNTIQVLRAKE